MIKICKEKKATPSHVSAAHGMTFAEYKKNTDDEDFMATVEKHRDQREERDSREYHQSRILTYYWYPESRGLTRVMGRFVTHAKTTEEALNPTVDLTKFMNLDEAVVGTIIIADALMKDGWECVMTKGGHGTSPKEYYMRRT